jgi:hypothetical protein
MHMYCTIRHFYLPICSFYFMLPSTAQFNLVYFVSSPSAPSQPKFFLSVATWISVSLYLPSDLIQLLFRFSSKKFLAFIFLYSPLRSLLTFIHFTVQLFFFFCRLVYFTFSGVLFVLPRLCLMSFFVASKVLFPFCPNVYFIRVTSIRFQFAFPLPGFDLYFLSFQSRQP